ncbi:MAG: beta-Ala-His dipeptidase [Eubacterium sp.]|nr:beta-Ala-His dipeptidase [Eubacterium sp.]
MKRKVLPICLSAILLFSLTAFSVGGNADSQASVTDRNIEKSLLNGSVTGSAANMDSKDEKLIDDFIEAFKLLAAVPRQSKHEKTISDSLKKWIENNGYNVVQNEANDLIYDIPATSGCEGLPLVGLQAHIDMVCVAEEGKVFDPLTDPIEPIIDRERGTMTANGTSLGADDGAGVVLIMMITQGRIASHGPLRVFLTTDEEEDMTGVLSIKEEDIAGVKYLINIDGEQSNTVMISSAADMRVTTTQKPKMIKSKKKSARKITISGLLGGHSGVMINEGRCNGNIALADTLTTLRKSVPFDLVSFHGGTAENAIPDKAEAVIQIRPADEKKLDSIVKKQLSTLKKKYNGIETSINLFVEKTKRSKKALKKSVTNSFLKYATEVIDGVYTMSTAIEGLVESSSNLGRMDASEKEVSMIQLVRSSSPDKLEEIRSKMEKLAKNINLSYTSQNGSRAWPVKTDSILVPKITTVYKELTGNDMIASAVHAGLECGAFSELDPELDIAGIGPDVVDVHSPKETLYLNSIPIVFNLLENVLVSL